MAKPHRSPTTGVCSRTSPPLPPTRYHSLVVKLVSAVLEVTAETEEGEIMGLRHGSCPSGVCSFIPSILTEHGHTMMQNFWT